MSLGDTILSSSDLIGYKIASCKLVGFAAMTPNVCLLTFRTETVFFKFFKFLAFRCFF